MMCFVTFTVSRRGSLNYVRNLASRCQFLFRLIYREGQAAFLIVSLYRVSHEILRFVNSFNVILYLLDIKDFLKFISLKNFYSNIFTLKLILLLYDCHKIFWCKHLNKLWKKTLKTIFQLSCFVGHLASPAFHKLAMFCLFKNLILSIFINQFIEIVDSKRIYKS